MGDQSRGLTEHVDIRFADFTGDGLVDMVYSTTEFVNRIRLFPNDSAPMNTPGDADGDGDFDRFDIVQLLQAGKYEVESLPVDTIFAEGDFNRDGEFNQLDLVLALQSGKYAA